MKYVLIDYRYSGDIFTKFFDTLEEAQDKAHEDWSHLTDSKRRNEIREFFIAICRYNKDIEGYTYIEKIWDIYE